MDGGTVLFKRLNGDGSRSLSESTVDLMETRKKKRSDSLASSPLFRAAKENDVSSLNKLIRQGYRLDERGPFGQHCLHIALLHDSNDVALKVMDNELTLINSPVMSQVFLGETALHIAIMNHNFLMVKELVRRGADVVTPRANGTFFHKGKKCSVYYGEYPLSFAACTGQVEVLRFLHQHGAPLDAQDSYGNTALHLLSMIEDKEVAKKIYDLVLSLEPAKSTQLERIANHQGLTPLKMAAYLANLELFEHMVNQKKEVHWSFGSTASVIYNVDQIDSYGEKKSVLHIIAHGKHNKKSCSLLTIQPVKGLMEHKWHYLRPWFLLFGGMYVIYMTIFTLVCYYRPSKLERFNSTQRQSTFLDFYQQPIDNWRLVGELLSILGALYMLFRAVSSIIYDKWRYLQTPGPGPLHIVNWCFCLLVLILMVMRLLNAHGETAVMAVTLLLGWTHCLYYGLAFKLTGPYQILLQKVLLTDFFRFLLLYFATLVGFSGAFILLFKETPSPPPSFTDYGSTMLALIKIVVGLEDLKSLTESSYPGLALALYIVYMFVVFIILMSLLIAMTAHTYKADYKDVCAAWKLQTARLTLYLERTLPNCVKWRSGVPGSRVGRSSNEWYIRCEEKSLDPKRMIRCQHSAPDPSDDEGLCESQDNMWNINEAFDFGDVTQPNSVASTPGHSRTNTPQPYVIENNADTTRSTYPNNNSNFSHYQVTKTMELPFPEAGHRARTPTHSGVGNRPLSPTQKSFPGSGNRPLSPSEKVHSGTGNSRVNTPVSALYHDQSLRSTPVPRAPNHQLYIDVPQNLQDMQPRARSPLRAVSPHSRSRTPADMTNITTEF